ncbi:MAG: PQQ-binding-like beta-propeller repeat protein [Actinomycetota bacterium]
MVAEAGAASGGGGGTLRFVVYGDTTIFDGDGTAIGRLRPGNTYVAIEVTDNHLVIKSPTQGRAFVELGMVEIMPEDEAAASAAAGPGSAPVTGPAPAAAQATSAPATAAAPTAEPSAPGWRNPVVLAIAGLALAVVVLIVVLLTSGGGDGDSIAEPVAAETTDTGGPAGTDEQASDEQAGDDLVETGDGEAAQSQPTDGDSSADPADTGTDETPDGEAPDSDPAEAAAADDGAGADAPTVVVGSGVATADGTLENRGFTHTPWGTLSNTSAFDSTGPSQAPTAIWRLDDPLASDPVLVDGAIIAAFDDTSIRALDARTGAEIWRTELDIFRANSLWVAGDTVVATEGENHSLFDLATGEPVGSFERPEGIEGFAHDALLVAGVFVGVWTDSQPGDVRATVAAFDAATGDNLWLVETQAENFPNTMTFSAGSVIIGHGDTIRALDLLTGEQAWSYTVDQFLPQVVAAEAQLLVFRDTALRAIDAATGEVVWSGTLSSNTIHAIDGGFVVNPGTELGVIDLATGAVRSAGRVPDGFFGRGISAIGDGVGYVQLSEGSIIAIDLATASQLWTGQLIDDEFAPSTPMLVGEGLLFVVESDRQLVAAG